MPDKTSIKDILILAIVFASPILLGLILSIIFVAISFNPQGFFIFLNESNKIWLAIETLLSFSLTILGLYILVKFLQFKK